MEEYMKISFAICTHNEGDYIRSLLNKLTAFVESDIASGVSYEIVVVDDFSTDQETLDALDLFKDKIVLFEHALNRDYATHKNFLNSCCTGDWIFNLDADEFVTDDFLAFIPHLIDMNPGIEAFWVPRINTVDGLTIKHLQKWGWTLTKLENHRRIKVMERDSPEYALLRGFDFIISDEDGIVTYYEPIVSWPDYQIRLYKNDSKIVWTKPVHEQLTGFERFGMLPQDPDLAIRHYKDIDRQTKQNDFYETIQ
jgi:glycosyltransferase involved in cell wall biosynthesis